MGQRTARMSRTVCPGTELPSLIELMRMTREEWDVWTRASAMRRAGYAGFKRNVGRGAGEPAWPGWSSALRPQGMDGEPPGAPATRSRWLKKRLGDFGKTLRELTITARGIEVGEPLGGLRGILTGTPERAPGTRQSE